jgi:hypothetical protein
MSLALVVSLLVLAAVAIIGIIGYALDRSAEM